MKRPSTDIDAFRKVLASSKHIVVIAGAGLSAASGIPTFRGAGGMWRKYDAMKLATPQGFASSPSLIWQFYHYRREIALRAQPNDAHRILSALSLKSFRDKIAPHSTFVLITQNVDGLSTRSDKEVFQIYSEQPSDNPHMIEMHGRVLDVLCTSKRCRHIEFNTKSPICDALAGTEKLVDRLILDPEIPKNDLPHCSKCGSLARPGVVWFGEAIPSLNIIEPLVAQADLCLVVGTSSTVQPAASYAADVQDQGGQVAIFNLERTEGDDEADFLFLGPCEESLSKVFGMSVSQDGKISIPSAESS